MPAEIRTVHFSNKSQKENQLSKYFSVLSAVEKYNKTLKLSCDDQKVRQSEENTEIS